VRPDVPSFPSDVFVEVVRVLIIGLATAGGDLVHGGTGAALGACTGYVLGGVAGRGLHRAARRFDEALQRTPAVTLAAGGIGSIVGAAIGTIAGSASVVLLPGRWGWPVVALLAWTGVYAGFEVGARNGSELLLLLRRGTPVLDDAPLPHVVLVDSSAAMDGRLLALARSGFLTAELAVPRFVLDELRGLADAADPVRRRRARRALETLDALAVVVLPDEVPDHDRVDAKLAALGERLRARVLTGADLARLAEGLQEPLVPGEVVSLKLTRTGRDAGQAVGYLDDGTMIVVSDAVAHLGEHVDAEVTTSVPTARGRLVFARLAV
jgi:uncharacterized protein YacL